MSSSDPDGTPSTCKTRSPPAQKDQRTHAMATHRYMHMNQTVFSDTPHERGALGKPTVLLDNLGIIPACAGSTPSSPRPPRAGWNHPRVRGEHRARQRSTLPGSGSSPHTRGARDNAPARRPLLGIIPACAGSTSWRIGVQGFLRNHPRMRGEHAIPGSRPSRASGSSPHARGTLLAPRLPVGAQGIKVARVSRHGFDL